MTSQVKIALGDQSLSFPTNKGLILNQGQMISIKERIGYDRMAEEVKGCECYELAHKPRMLIKHTQHNLAIKKDPRIFFDEEWATKIIGQLSRPTIVPERYSVCKLFSSFITHTPITGELKLWEIPTIIQEIAKQIQCSAKQCGHRYDLYSDGSRSEKKLMRRNKTSAALVAIASTCN